MTRRSFSLGAALTLVGASTVSSTPPDPAYVAAIQAADTVSPFVGASYLSDESAARVATLGPHPMSAAGRTLTQEQAEQLKTLLTDRISDAGGAKECTFDPTVGYRFAGRDTIDVVICHGCAVLRAFLGARTYVVAIDPVQSDLLVFAGRLFPDEPRLRHCRAMEVLAYPTDDVIRGATRAKTYVGRPTGETSGSTIATLSRFDMIGEGPAVSGDTLARLQAILTNPLSYSFEGKLCIFDPTIGYLFESARGRIEVVICHTCAAIAVTSAISSPEGRTETRTRFAEIDPAEAALREIARSLFPTEPRLVR